MSNYCITRLVAAHLKTLVTQVPHHRAAIQAAERGRKQCFHAKPQRQFLGRDSFAWLSVPVLASAGLNAQHAAQPVAQDNRSHDRG